MLSFVEMINETIKELKIKRTRQQIEIGCLTEEIGRLESLAFKMEIAAEKEAEESE